MWLKREVAKVEPELEFDADCHGVSCHVFGPGKKV